MFSEVSVFHMPQKNSSSGVNSTKIVNNEPPNAPPNPAFLSLSWAARCMNRAPSRASVAPPPPVNSPSEEGRVVRIRGSGEANVHSLRAQCQ